MLYLLWARSERRSTSGNLFADGRSLKSASEAERREWLGLWVADISLMPNGTLDSGGLLLINLFARQPWQLGDIRRNPPSLVFREQLGS